MASLPDLPADQRAVLELVLARGRNYDQIAAILGIDRAGVRQRALAALDALGPDASVAPERRALITDYLLGQLPPRVAEDVRERLSREAADRAWARVVASELAELAAGPLPRIPSATPGGQGAAAGDVLPGAAPALPAGASAAVLAAAGRDTGPEAGGGESEPPATGAEEGAAPARRTSRLGGAILLGVGALVVVAVIVVAIVLGSGGNGGTHSQSTSSSPPAATGTTGTTGTTPAYKILAQVALSAAAGQKASTKGAAEAFQENGQRLLAVVAAGLTPNTKKDYYAVWLSNSAADSQLVGFVNPGVGSNGRLQAAALLPANASRFQRLLVTLETQQHPRQPGTVVLSGSFSLK